MESNSGYLLDPSCPVIGTFHGEFNLLLSVELQQHFGQILWRLLFVPGVGGRGLGDGFCFVLRGIFWWDEWALFVFECVEVLFAFLKRS